MTSTDQAERTQRKRDKIAKQYADSLILAMGLAERATYQDYFGFTDYLDPKKNENGKKSSLEKIETNGLSG